MTLEEIRFGPSWKPNLEVGAWFDGFLSGSCTILPIIVAIARRAGDLRGRLRAAGRQRTQADILLAATAQVHQLTLATRDVRDFEGCEIAVINPFGNP